MSKNKARANTFMMKVKRYFILGTVLALLLNSVVGCGYAREAFQSTRYVVSCRNEKNEEIAEFRCDSVALAEGLVVLEDCAGKKYKDKTVVLACPVITVKDKLKVGATQTRAD